MLKDEASARIAYRKFVELAGVYDESLNAISFLMEHGDKEFALGRLRAVATNNEEYSIDDRVRSQALGIIGRNDYAEMVRIYHQLANSNRASVRNFGEEGLKGLAGTR